MDDIDEPPKGILLAALKSCGCCPRCQLRFQQKRLPNEYLNIYNDDQEVCPDPDHPSDDISENQKVESKKICASLEKNGSVGGSKVCPLCLGILQDICEQDSINKIGDKIKDAEFEFETFSLAVTLPLELQIRQHSILLYLEEKHGISISSKDVVAIKDAFKWVCGARMTKSLGVPFSHKTLFEVLLSFKNAETKTEPIDLVHMKFPQAKKRRRSYKMRMNKTSHPDIASKQQVEDTLETMTSEEFKESFSCPPLPPQVLCFCQVSGLHTAVYVAGRYNKYSRALSQTPWICDGERKTESSVEELLCEPIKANLNADDYKFASSGREDVDVRTLGKGRPFVVEMINPHKINMSAEEMRALQQDINSRTTDIAVRDLQMVTREDTLELKQSVEEKTKSYSALIWTSKPIDKAEIKKLCELKDLKLQQKTPVRVLHRRSLATRERVVHSMSAEPVDENHFRLHLCTQSGTYIKEFVHGDFGRTQPNIGNLLSTQADILELDVEAVNLDWPKSLPDT